MTGADPYGDFILFYAAFNKHFGKALARSLFYALHTEHKNLVFNVVCGDLLHKSAQSLRGD